MKTKNLVAESFTWIFTVASFFIYAKSVVEKDVMLSYLTVFIYIVPQLISCISDYSYKHLAPFMVKLSLVSIIAGTLVVCSTLILMAFNAPFMWWLKWILILMSSVYIIRTTCYLSTELRQYYKIHSQNNKKGGFSL